MGTGDTLLGGGRGGGRGGYPAMDQHPVQGRVAILLGMRHAKETVWAFCSCAPLHFYQYSTMVYF